MNILFTYYPLYVRFSHAASLLTAICEQRGIKADYCACDELSTRMRDYGVIAFSLVTDADYKQCIPYMEMAMQSGRLVIAGGVYARRGGYIDPTIVHKVCRGEAETIPDFLINGDTSIFDTICFRKSLDGLPTPDLSHVQGNEFHRGLTFLQGLKIIPYQTSRGCPYRCSFCETQFQPKTIRMKHSIEQDIKKLQHDHNPDLFYLLDELPPYYRQEWREQWESINAPFLSYIRADIDPEWLEFMIAHGLKVAAFGIESTDENFRNIVLNKAIMDSEIKRTVSILKKHDVHYLAFYMTGIPHEIPLDNAVIREIGGTPIIWEYQNLRNSIPMEV